LQALLTTNGWTVLLTRSNDVSMSLPERVAFADQHKADFFLSLHFNSVSPDDQAAGLQTYCLTPQGMPSNETRGFRDDWSLAFPNNNFDTENIQYAARLHRAALKVNGHLDRGVQRARFMRVVREQNRPAVLMEGGFLSNPREARHIADPAYRQKLAEALAQALLENAESTPTITNQPVVSATAAPATNHAAVSTNATGAPEVKKQNEREGTK
jgi:N-acetylmuramoyl-L-alanine amidase